MVGTLFLDITQEAAQLVPTHTHPGQPQLAQVTWEGTEAAALEGLSSTETVPALQAVLVVVALVALELPLLCTTECQV
jgi:hypothetical protein